MAEHSPSPSTPDRETLIQGYLDGSLDADGCNRLLAMLKEDPKLAQEVVADLRLDEMLRKNFRDQHAASPDALPSVTEASAKERPGSKRGRRPSASRLRARRSSPSTWPVALMAASVLLAIGAYLLFTHLKPSAPSHDVAHQNTPREQPTQTPHQAPPVIATAQSTRQIARIASLPQGAAESCALIRIQNDTAVRLPATEGLAIHLGDRLETAASTQVNVRYDAEETTLQVGADTTATFNEENNAKRIALDRGSLQADVAPQPQGHPMILTTPQATAEVLGTQLVLSSRDDASCLAVIHGKVMLGGKQERRNVLVSTGQYAVAGTYEPLEARRLAPVPGLFQLIEDNENGMHWSGVPWSDPVNVSLSNAHAATGTSAIRLEYRHRPMEQGGRGYGMISHPVTLKIDDRFACTRVYVEQTDTPSILNVMIMLRDGSSWFMRDVRLTRRPARTWFTFVAPLQTPKKKNNEAGGDQYDPTQAVSVQLSIFGGNATVYLDDLGLSAVDPLQSPGE